MGRIIGRLLRIIAWLAPFYQFRASVWRKCGVKIGKRVFVANFVFFDGQYPHLIEIEDEASIGPFAVLIAHASGSAYHRRTRSFKQEPRPIKVRRGAWIAAGAIILPGVTIGKGSIVAAGSVVSRDVPDHVIVAGNPARVVSKLKIPKIESE